MINIIKSNINKLFSNAKVSQSTTVIDLKEIIEHCQDKIDMLEEDGL